jgi:CRP-like cAMP-binding protein
MFANLPVLRRAIRFALSDADLQALSRRCEERRYGPGEIVFREGDPGSSLFLVAEGALDVYVGAVVGAQPVATMGAGKLLGEVASGRARPRPATAIAGRRSMAIEIDGDAVTALRKSAPLAARALQAAVIAGAIHRMRQLVLAVERELEREAASA